MRPAPLTPDFASQTMPADRSVTPLAIKRLDGEIGGSGIAAGIGDQARGANALAAELGEPIDGFREQMRAQCAVPCTSASRWRRREGGKRR